MPNYTTSNEPENIKGEATVSEKLDALMEYLHLEVVDHPVKEVGGKIIRKKQDAQKEIVFEQEREKYW